MPKLDDFPCCSAPACDGGCGVDAPLPDITAPGVYRLPVERYHADPVEGGSLSASEARLLLSPSCPALYSYLRDHPEDRPPKKQWDIGHAAHRLVLGTGPELVLVDRERWDTKAVKEELAAIRERGAVPLKRSDMEQVEAMAAALRRHPLAGKLFDPERIEAEQTLVWRDGRTGIWRRALVDSLPRQRGGARRMILADYKTSISAEPERIGRAMADYGYHIQAAWHSDGAAALGLADDVRFMLVVQEKTPPYLVTVAEPDMPSVDIGRKLAREAIDIYERCVRTGQWPAYPAGPDKSTTEDTVWVTLPVWELRKHEETW